MAVSFEPVQYEAKFHLWVQHTTLLPEVQVDGWLLGRPGS